MDIKKAIRALLLSKFGGVQLSDARVEQFAKRLEGKVTTEEELETRLVTLDEALPFADIAKEDDRVRGLEAAAKKKPADPPAPTDPPAPAPEDPNKAILDALKGLTETVAGLKGEKVVNDRKSAILAKLKDADEGYSAKVLRDFGRMTFADDAAFEEYLGEVETDFTSFVQTTAESQLGKDAPFVASGKDGKPIEASKEELDAAFSNM